MRNGIEGIGSVLFGTQEQTEVERGLAEFRGGRPVRLIEDGEAVFALPLEGLTDDRLDAFRALCRPQLVKLIISARRARALGIDATAPTALLVPANARAGAYVGLAGDRQATNGFAAEAASSGASAAIELVKLVQGLPAVLAASVEEDVQAREIATVRCAAVAGFRAAIVRSLAIAGEARVPLSAGATTRFVVFRDVTGSNSVAVVIGEPDFSAPVTVRIHSACLTGDVFGSRRCDCGDQLRLALDRIEATGGGVILYLAQEGRGLGLVNKMRAYGLQDAGLDTIDANHALGFDDDERDYGLAARILEILGITRVWLLTNNPAKLAGLAQAGIKVAGRMPLEAPVNADNRRYLAAKAARAGHQFQHLIAGMSASAESERGAARSATVQIVSGTVESPEPGTRQALALPAASPARSA